MRSERSWASTLLAAVALMGCGTPDLTYADRALERDASAVSPETDGDTDATGTVEAGSELNGDAAPPRGESGDDDGPLAPLDAALPDGARSCTDAVLDGDETSVDCGGDECPRCPAGRSCKVDDDCISAFCHRGTCARATCVDHIKNLKETDVDCGGGDCHPCNVGATCETADDCALQNCVEAKCQPSSCDDQIRTTGETDVDCGGALCAPCPAGKTCISGSDCASTLCGSDLRCAPATCSDEAKNGDETDKNCGGASCPKCLDGQTCRTGADCGNGVCAMTCQRASCNDQVRNGAESDIDCGGSCATCRSGERCTTDADCLSGNCNVSCQPCPRDMVAVAVAPPLASYCIDAIEVTIDAYARFLEAPPRASSVPLVCAENASYLPGVPLDRAHPTNPVGAVDWCDAYTFCAERGRHLCGRIGERRALLETEELDRTRSEWFNACTGTNAHLFPYGDTYDEAACAGADRKPQNSLWTTGSNTCEGGVAGLFDMSGNVAEWEDNCTGVTGGSDTCEVRGGSFEVGGGNGGPLRCSAGSTLPRSTNDDPAVGFRCCL